MYIGIGGQVIIGVAVRLTNNTANTGGGAVAANSSSIIAIAGATFENNAAAGWRGGGAVLLVGSSTFTVPLAVGTKSAEFSFNNATASGKNFSCEDFFVCL